MSGTSAEGMQQLLTQVRSRIDAQEINPVLDQQRVLHLVEDALTESVDAQHATIPVKHVLEQMTGFGVLSDFMLDDTIEEIWLNEPGRIFIARGGRSELTSVVMTDEQVRSLVERLLATTGRRVDVSHPFVDATLADGSRLHVAIPDITHRHWKVNIRKFSRGRHSLSTLVATGTLTDQAASFLHACIASGVNVVVSGATQAGKTTLMNALLNSAPAHERIITCEEVFELQLTAPDWVALQAREPSLDGSGEITLRRLIKEALRMRPTRLVIGEVRQEECLDLLIAMNSGMPSMCSIHANNARAAIAKMCLLPMLAGSNVSAEFVVPTVAAVVDIVVHTALQADGQRRVQSIAAVNPRSEGNVVEMADLFTVIDSELHPTGAFPARQEAFTQHGFDLPLLLGSKSWV